MNADRMIDTKSLLFVILILHIMGPFKIMHLDVGKFWDFFTRV